jgi:glutamate synthase (NADPH/NADH) large chain
MTGGVVYLLHHPEEGLTREFLFKRLAHSAKVALLPVNEHDIDEIRNLMEPVLRVLTTTKQNMALSRIESIISKMPDRFLKVLPTSEQADPSISTE